MVFQKIIRQNRGKQLIDMLEFLDSQLYCHLDASYEPTIRKLEVLRAPPVPKTGGRKPADDLQMITVPRSTHDGVVFRCHSSDISLSMP